MKSTNLLIIGSAVVLGGLYLSNKSKKDKADAQAQALANNATQNNSTTSTSSTDLLTQKEATVYATKTIADVNSILVKFPAIKKDEFIKNYNSAYGTKLFIENNGSINSPEPTQKDVKMPITTPIVENTQSGSGMNWNGILTDLAPSLINQSRNLELAKSMVANRVSDANRVFNATQMGYTQWKSDFSTVYSNLKDYYSTLTKQQADVIIKYLPKMIVQSLMGDNDPRAKNPDFYTQEEIMDMVDNKINQEQTLQSALGGFITNIRRMNGEPIFSNLDTILMTTVKPILVK
jgi:outer membrane murein-binding lipoprotein Lpp